MRYLPSALAALGLAGYCLSQPALAAPLDGAQNTENIFVMGGPFTTGYFQDTFSFWQDHYEENFFAGAGYQYFFYNYGGTRIGAELGAGLRFGDAASAEVWAGLVARYDGFRLGDFSISPAITFGLSATTGTIGIETQRVADLGYGVPILYYLAPEISLSHAAFPDLEVLARVQHRSGGFGTIAPIDASNAAVVGLRYKF